MWLDRLPLKKDVVSHYFYALQDLRNNGIPIRDNYLLSLTANVVKYIWLEIDVPTIDLPSIIKQLQNILGDVLALHSCCRIWEERGLLFPGDMRRRFQEIYERDRKKFHRGELPSIYRDGLALSSHKKKAPSVERLTDVEAYCQFHLDQLDREVMDLFPFSSASIRKKIIDGNPTINKSSSSVVEETEVGHFTLTGIDLTIPDFESYISGDKIDPNKWQISVDASDEVTLEEDMDHEMNNAYDDPDDFITEKNSSDAFTQTFMTCPIDYSFNWPFNVDM